MAFAILLGLGMLIWSVVETEFLTGAIFQVLISLYLIICQAQSMKGRNNVKFLDSLPGYLYILAALTMVGWTLLYLEIATDCFHAYFGTTDNEYSCPLPECFNHNAVLHLLMLIFVLFLFFGVWVEKSQELKHNAGDEFPEAEEVDVTVQAEMINLVGADSLSANEYGNARDVI